MTMGSAALMDTGMPWPMATELAGSADNLTATAGGTQITSLVLVNTISRIGTIATSGDGVTLPFAKAGAEFWVINGIGNKAATVFGSGSDTVNLIAGATGFTLPGGKTAVFKAPADAKWGALLSA